MQLRRLWLIALLFAMSVLPMPATAQTMLEAAERGDTATIDRLISSGAPIDAMNASGQTALLLAVCGSATPLFAQFDALNLGGFGNEPVVVPVDVEVDLYSGRPNPRFPLSPAAAAELERRRDHRRIHQLAYIDTITELPNRAHFMEQLATLGAQAQCERKSLTLVLLDLRRFKEINDLHGHQVGDALLATVARRLQQLHDLSGHCARLSSDEFALLLPQHLLPWVIT